jgi:hypothetical protein
MYIEVTWSCGGNAETDGCGQTRHCKPRKKTRRQTDNFQRTKLLRCQLFYSLWVAVKTVLHLRDKRRKKKKMTREFQP